MPQGVNYFGAMEPAVRMQESGESFYFLADYHAMSTVHDANTLRENCSNLATDFLAVGLDPEKCVFFRQSAVPEVNELAWILSTVCPMGLLERCHQCVFFFPIYVLKVRMRQQRLFRAGIIHGIFHFLPSTEFKRRFPRQLVIERHPHHIPLHSFHAYLFEPQSGIIRISGPY